MLMDDCSPTRVGGQCSAEAQGDQAWEMRTWTLCTNTFGAPRCHPFQSIYSKRLLKTLARDSSTSRTGRLSCSKTVPFPTGYEAPAEDALAAETVMSYGLAGSTINRLGQVRSNNTGRKHTYIHSERLPPPALPSQAQTPAWEIYAASCGPARNGHSYCQGHSVFGSVLMYLCSGTPTDSSQSGSNGVVTCDWQVGALPPRRITLGL